MHHEEGAGAPMRLVVQIGEAETEGAMHDAVRIELLGVDRIEALRRLAIALLQLRPEPPGPEADRIGGEADEAPVLLHPYLQLMFELEDADIDRHAHFHARGRQPLIDMLEVGRARQGLAGAEAGHVVGARHVDAHAVDQLAAFRREQVDAGAAQHHNEDQSQELTHAETDHSQPEDRV